MNQRTRIYALAGIVTVLLLLILLTASSGAIRQWLWMRELGFTVIFWKVLTIRWGAVGIVFVSVLCLTWLNFLPVSRAVARTNRMSGGKNVIWGPPNNVHQMPIGIVKMIGLVGAVALALVFASTYYTEWDTIVRFHWGGLSGQNDPIFGKDLGFYLFHLPFYSLLQNSLTGLMTVNLIAVCAAYIYFGVIHTDWRNWMRQDRKALGHIAAVLAALIASWAWGYYLDRYELLFSQTGVVYGVGYTTYHVTRISLWVMIFAALSVGAIILASIAVPRLKNFLLPIVGGFVVLYSLLIIVLPGVIQRYKVAPSELELETPFLEHSIAFTRKAYQLDRVRVQTYPALQDLTQKELADNKDTIDNVRLWDWRPILKTYRQTQEMRLYYQFYNVDLGRYHLNDGYHQVMLSARELAPQLPAKARTWVNEHLQFTHGYGAVMNFVSKKTPEGLPDYILENIPPQSDQGIQITQPAIYYGENSPGYRIVSTKVKEFDYPKGDNNVYTSYDGTGGIPLDAAWKRLLFSWTQSDINILLSSYLEPQSRIQIWRSVRQRVSRIVPFLKLDQDPYLVLSQGRLFWIQDLYTASDRFPYAQPYEKSYDRFNYIRNSVKAVVDIYNGSVTFYAMDPEEPILKAYAHAFPGVFKSLDTMPADLKSHLRYPEDLFSIQTDLYRTFHMTDPQVFYNQEDLWTFPQEKYAGESITVEPYYILMRLPGTKRLEYMLMTSFTPQSKDNMISWMAAKCDFPEYGQLMVYQLPKERLIYGPIQVEAMIDQNTRISEQLSLWDQRGSRVIRGNLIVIPIENGFIYVEPVYLTAEGINIPQLKRVIAIYGDQVAMAPTLDKALDMIFGSAAPEPVVMQMPAPAQSSTLKQVSRLFQQARKALQESRWTDYGKSMEALQKILANPPEKISDETGQPQPQK